MTISKRRGTGVLALLIAITLTGCSSSSKSGSSSGAVSSAAFPSGVPTPADAQTKAAVTAAYKTFFNTNTTPAQSETALQHGAVFRKTLESEANSPNAKKTTATVSAVSVAGDTASVTYSLLQGGSPLLANQHGYAVRENGTWKVAAETFCVLLKLEGTAPPACNDAAVIAVPH